MKPRTLVLGALALLLAIGACEEGRDDVDATVSSSGSATDSAETSAAGPDRDDPDASPTGGTPSGGTDVGEAAYVIDGDTFALTDGRIVRVLGIDSCEFPTASGRQALDDARRLLAGQAVTLTREPGVDLDRYARHLRYVATPGGRDFGSSMIGYEHTGVYEGGDAAPTYTAQLRGLDDGPRVCDPVAEPDAPPPPSARPEPEPQPRPEPRPLARPAPAPAPAPAPEPPPRKASASNCHPSYTPCVPDGPDLDCPEIGFQVTVTGPDEYRLDRDGDGRGCASY